MPDRAIGSEQEYGVWNNEKGSEFTFSKTSGEFLENGCRLYDDCSHPEYASPETRSALDAVIYDKAGEIVVRRNIDTRNRLFKNNRDYMGDSYGSHENYCVVRNGDLNGLVDFTLPFLVSRIIFSGSGTITSRFGRTRFEISQKSGFTRDIYSPATTYHKPIFNTKDEPHASLFYRRLHVVCGDANMSEIALFLKFGTAKLILDLYEEGVKLPFSLQNPLDAMHSISCDLEFRSRYKVYDGNISYRGVRDILIARMDRVIAKVNFQFQSKIDQLHEKLREIADDPEKIKLKNKLRQELRNIEREKQTQIAYYGKQVKSELDREFPTSGTMSAIKIQRHYQKLAEQHLRGRDNETNEILDRWNHVLTGLEGDVSKQPDLDRWLDWRIKRSLMRRYEDRGVSLGDPKMKSIDIQYHELGGRGLFYILQGDGFVDRMVGDSEIARAAINPPENTRAKVRGMAVRALNALVNNWSRIVISKRRKKRGLCPCNCPDCITKTGNVFELDEPLHTYPELQRMLVF